MPPEKIWEIMQQQIAVSNGKSLKQKPEYFLSELKSSTDYIKLKEIAASLCVYLKTESISFVINFVQLGGVSQLINIAKDLVSQKEYFIYLFIYSSISLFSIFMFSFSYAHKEISRLILIN